MHFEARTPTGSYTSVRFPIDKVPGSDWIVVGEVWSSEITGDLPGEMIVTEIHYDGDDPNFSFHDPADYPRLPATTVESANRRYRKEHRLYERRMTEYDPKLWRDLDYNEMVALNRMGIHRQEPWNTNGLLLDETGGFVVPGMIIRNHPLDWIAQMLVERLKAKFEKDYATADAIRREIEKPTPYIVFDHPDGTEFVRGSDCG